MGRIIVIFTLTLLSNLVFSKNFDPKKLNDEISALNNHQKYDQSILVLEEIINNPSSSPFEIYHAYLQKALTYKRLYNYSEVLANLESALEWGNKSPHKKEVQARIKIEKLFIHFDMLNFDQVDVMLPTITPEDVKLVDAQTQAFYISLLAVYDMRNQRYKEAEEKLYKCIELLVKNSPKDLPNIYRKLITLYGYLDNEKKAKEAYDQGIKYANLYNIGVYKIAMNEEMSKFYMEREDYKNAIHYHTQRLNEFRQYNVSNENDKLKILERDLLKNRKDLEIRYEQKLRYYMVILVVILLAFLLVLFKLLKSNQQKRKFIEGENARMRQELENLSLEKNEKGEGKTDFSQYNLTQRQIDIINLVKQGKTNKEIGAILFISENTVKYHLKIIYNALGIENRYDL